MLCQSQTFTEQALYERLEQVNEIYLNNYKLLRKWFFLGLSRIFYQDYGVTFHYIIHVTILSVIRNPNIIVISQYLRSMHWAKVPQICLQGGSNSRPLVY